MVHRKEKRGYVMEKKMQEEQEIKDTQEQMSDEEQKPMEEDVEAVEAVEEGEKAEKAEVVDETQEQIAKLEQQCADNLDKYQRCLAEFDNFRKRTSREKASMYDDGVRDTVEKLLPVVDNLERAMAAQEGKMDEEDGFYKGVKMTLKQFQEILTALGVEEIKALGEKFDPNVHAAVAHEDSDEYGENEVILEMLKGYKYKERVIRHSMVKVAN